MIEPVALLKDLVRINTTNPPGEEEKLLLYLERILQEHGIPYVYQKSAKGRGNLLAWQLAVCLFCAKHTLVAVPAVSKSFYLHYI